MRHALCITDCVTHNLFKLSVLHIAVHNHFIRRKREKERKKGGETVENTLGTMTMEVE